MPVIPYTVDQLKEEGAQCLVTIKPISDYSAIISWSLPASISVYDGILVLLNTAPFNPSNYPTNSVRYLSSSDFSNPADLLGSAVVVGAFYNDPTTTSLTVTGINFALQTSYYVSVHACTNVYQYYIPGVQSYPLNNTTDAFTGDIPTSSTPPLNPNVGEVYYDPNANAVSMWNGMIWIPAGTGTVWSDYTPAANPVPGQFFYSLHSQTLMVWNGTAWVQANTGSSGTPMYNKQGVGTDGTPDERLHLIDILRRQLGHPVVCVELTEDQFNIAIDNALQEYRRRVDVAYGRRYIFLKLNATQQTYYLNDPVAGSNQIVDIIKIQRLSNLSSLFQGDNAVYGQAILSQFYSPQVMDLLSLHLVAQLAETFNMIFAGYLDFTWDEAQRELRIFRALYRDEKVLIECVMEKTEQEILVDRFATQWIQQWAMGESMMMLGQIRSKFGSFGGPNGGISLNGADLIGQAQSYFEDCIRQVQDYEVGNAGSEFGLHSFLIG